MAACDLYFGKASNILYPGDNTEFVNYLKDKGIDVSAFDISDADVLTHTMHLLIAEEADNFYREHLYLSPLYKETLSRANDLLKHYGYGKEVLDEVERNINNSNNPYAAFYGLRFVMDRIENGEAGQLYFDGYYLVKEDLRALLSNPSSFIYRESYKLDNEVVSTLLSDDINVDKFGEQESYEYRYRLDKAFEDLGLKEERRKSQVKHFVIDTLALYYKDQFELRLVDGNTFRYLISSGLREESSSIGAITTFIDGKPVIFINSDMSDVDESVIMEELLHLFLYGVDFNHPIIRELYNHVMSDESFANKVAKIRRKYGRLLNKDRAKIQEEARNLGISVEEHIENILREEILVHYMADKTYVGKIDKGLLRRLWDHIWDILLSIFGLEREKEARYGLISKDSKLKDVLDFLNKRGVPVYGYDSYARYHASIKDTEKSVDELRASLLLNDNVDTEAINNLMNSVKHLLHALASHNKDMYFMSGDDITKQFLKVLSSIEMSIGDSDIKGMDFLSLTTHYINAAIQYNRLFTKMEPQIELFSYIVRHLVGHLKSINEEIGNNENLDEYQRVLEFADRITKMGLGIPFYAQDEKDRITHFSFLLGGRETVSGAEVIYSFLIKYIDENFMDDELVEIGGKLYDKRAIKEGLNSVRLLSGLQYIINAIRDTIKTNKDDKGHIKDVYVDLSEINKRYYVEVLFRYSFLENMIKWYSFSEHYTRLLNEAGKSIENSNLSEQEKNTISQALETLNTLVGNLKNRIDENMTHIFMANNDDLHRRCLIKSDSIVDDYIKEHPNKKDTNVLLDYMVDVLDIGDVFGFNINAELKNIKANELKESNYYSVISRALEIMLGKVSYDQHRVSYNDDIALAIALAIKDYAVEMVGDNKSVNLFTVLNVLLKSQDTSESRAQIWASVLHKAAFYYGEIVKVLRSNGFVRDRAYVNVRNNLNQKLKESIIGVIANEQSDKLESYLGVIANKNISNPEVWYYSRTMIDYELNPKSVEGGSAGLVYLKNKLIRSITNLFYPSVVGGANSSLLYTVVHEIYSDQKTADLENDRTVRQLSKVISDESASHSFQLIHHITLSPNFNEALKQASENYSKDVVIFYHSVTVGKQIPFYLNKVVLPVFNDNKTNNEFIIRKKEDVYFLQYVFNQLSCLTADTFMVNEEQKDNLNQAMIHALTHVITVIEKDITYGSFKFESKDSENAYKRNNKSFIVDYLKDVLKELEGNNDKKAYKITANRITALLNPVGLYLYAINNTQESAFVMGSNRNLTIVQEMDKVGDKNMAEANNDLLNVILTSISSSIFNEMIGDVNHYIRHIHEKESALFANIVKSNILLYAYYRKMLEQKDAKSVNYLREYTERMRNMLNGMMREGIISVEGTSINDIDDLITLENGKVFMDVALIASDIVKVSKPKDASYNSGLLYNVVASLLSATKEVETPDEMALTLRYFGIGEEQSKDITHKIVEVYSTFRNKLVARFSSSKEDENLYYWAYQFMEVFYMNSKEVIDKHKLAAHAPINRILNNDRDLPNVLLKDEKAVSSEVKQEIRDKIISGLSYLNTFLNTTTNRGNVFGKVEMVASTEVRPESSFNLSYVSNIPKEHVNGAHLNEHIAMHNLRTSYDIAHLSGVRYLIYQEYREDSNINPALSVKDFMEKEGNKVSKDDAAKILTLWDELVSDSEDINGSYGKLFVFNMMMGILRDGLLSLFNTMREDQSVSKEHVDLYKVMSLFLYDNLLAARANIKLSDYNSLSEAISSLLSQLYAAIARQNTELRDGGLKKVLLPFDGNGRIVSDKKQQISFADFQALSNEDKIKLLDAYFSQVKVDERPTDYMGFYYDVFRALTTRRNNLDLFIDLNVNNASLSSELSDAITLRDSIKEALEGLKKMHHTLMVRSADIFETYESRYVYNSMIDDEESGAYVFDPSEGFYLLRPEKVVRDNGSINNDRLIISMVTLKEYINDQRQIQELNIPTTPSIEEDDRKYKLTTSQNKYLFLDYLTKRIRDVMIASHHAIVPQTHDSLQFFTDLLLNAISSDNNNKYYDAVNSDKQRLLFNEIFNTVLNDKDDEGNTLRYRLRYNKTFSQDIVLYARFHYAMVLLALLRKIDILNKNKEMLEEEDKRRQAIDEEINIISYYLKGLYGRSQNIELNDVVGIDKVIAIANSIMDVYGFDETKDKNKPLLNFLDNLISSTWFKEYYRDEIITPGKEVDLDDDHNVFYYRDVYLKLSDNDNRNSEYEVYHSFKGSDGVMLLLKHAEHYLSGHKENDYSFGKLFAYNKAFPKEMYAHQMDATSDKRHSIHLPFTWHNISHKEQEIAIVETLNYIPKFIEENKRTGRNVRAHTWKLKDLYVQVTEKDYDDQLFWQDYLYKNPRIKVSVNPFVRLFTFNEFGSHNSEDLNRSLFDEGRIQEWTATDEIDTDFNTMHLVMALMPLINVAHQIARNKNEEYKELYDKILRFFYTYKHLSNLYNSSGRYNEEIELSSFISSLDLLFEEVSDSVNKLLSFMQSYSSSVKEDKNISARDREMIDAAITQLYMLRNIHIRYRESDIRNQHKNMYLLMEAYSRSVMDMMTRYASINMLTTLHYDHLNKTEDENEIKRLILWDISGMNETEPSLYENIINRGVVFLSYLLYDQSKEHYLMLERQSKNPSVTDLLSYDPILYLRDQLSARIIKNRWLSSDESNHIAEDNTQYFFNGDIHRKTQSRVNTIYFHINLISTRIGNSLNNGLLQIPNEDPLTRVLTYQYIDKPLVRNGSLQWYDNNLSIQQATDIKEEETKSKFKAKLTKSNLWLRKYFLEKGYKLLFGLGAEQSTYDYITYGHLREREDTKAMNINKMANIDFIGKDSLPNESDMSIALSKQVYYVLVNHNNALHPVNKSVLSMLAAGVGITDDREQQNEKTLGAFSEALNRTSRMNEDTSTIKRKFTRYEAFMRSYVLPVFNAFNSYHINNLFNRMLIVRNRVMQMLFGLLRKLAYIVVFSIDKIPNIIANIAGTWVLTLLTIVYTHPTSFNPNIKGIRKIWSYFNNILLVLYAFIKFVPVMVYLTFRDWFWLMVSPGNRKGISGWINRMFYNMLLKFDYNVQIYNNIARSTHLSEFIHRKYTYDSNFINALLLVAHYLGHPMQLFLFIKKTLEATTTIVLSDALSRMYYDKTGKTIRESVLSNELAQVPDEDKNRFITMVTNTLLMADGKAAPAASRLHFFNIFTSLRQYLIIFGNKLLNRGEGIHGKSTKGIVNALTLSFTNGFQSLITAFKSKEQSILYWKSFVKNLRNLLDKIPAMGAVTSATAVYAWLVSEFVSKAYDLFTEEDDCFGDKELNNIRSEKISDCLKARKEKVDEQINVDPNIINRSIDEKEARSGRRLSFEEIKSTILSYVEDKIKNSKDPVAKSEYTLIKARIEAYVDILKTYAHYHPVLNGDPEYTEVFMKANLLSNYYYMFTSSTRETSDFVNLYSPFALDGVIRAYEPVGNRMGDKIVKYDYDTKVEEAVQRLREKGIKLNGTDITKDDITMIDATLTGFTMNLIRNRLTDNTAVGKMKDISDEINTLFSKHVRIDGSMDKGDIVDLINNYYAKRVSEKQYTARALPIFYNVLIDALGTSFFGDHPIVTQDLINFVNKSIETLHTNLKSYDSILNIFHSTTGNVNIQYASLNLDEKIKSYDIYRIFHYLNEIPRPSGYYDKSGKYISVRALTEASVGFAPYLYNLANSRHLFIDTKEFLAYALSGTMGTPPVASILGNFMDISPIMEDDPSISTSYILWKSGRPGSITGGNDNPIITWAQYNTFVDRWHLLPAPSVLFRTMQMSGNGNSRKAYKSGE